MDSTGALDLPDIRKRCFVIGGGYIGLNWDRCTPRSAQRSPSSKCLSGLLPGADRDLVVCLCNKPSGKTLLRILLNTTVKSLKDEKTGIRVTLDGPNVKEEKRKASIRPRADVGWAAPEFRDPGLDKNES